MINTYEEYMQNVLGFNTNNTYGENNRTNYFVGERRYTQNLQAINKLYPEIYKIIYPLIQKVCSKRRMREVTEEELSQMTSEIYNVVQSNEDEKNTDDNSRRNGDVRNPRARETVSNQIAPKDDYMLRDLIKILIIRELLQTNSNFFPRQIQSQVPEDFNRYNMMQGNAMPAYWN